MISNKAEKEVSHSKAALDTFPKLLIANSKRFANRPAMRVKNKGKWQSWTWREMSHEIMRLSYGLKIKGLNREDKIAIWGSNRPRLYWGFCAAQAIGGVPLPLDFDTTKKELLSFLQHSKASIALCQNQAQVDQLLSILEELPDLKTIIYDEKQGAKDHEYEHLYSFDEIQEAGDAIFEKITITPWLDTIKLGKGADLSTLLYRADDLKKPKGVMLSYDNLILSAQNANQMVDLNENEVTLAHLPLASICDHLHSYAQAYTAGFCVSCPQSKETQDADRRQILPTYFIAPPHMFKTLYDEILAKIETSGAFKRKFSKAFLNIAQKYGEARLNLAPISLKGRFLYALGNFFIYGALRKHTGFDHLKHGFSVADGISPSTFDFFRSLGINLKRLYGQSEASLFISAQKNGKLLAKTVGKACKDVEIKIHENGEVLYKSPSAFIGYFEDEAATDAVKLKDGWVKSGDFGFLDGENELHIIGEDEKEDKIEILVKSDAKRDSAKNEAAKGDAVKGDGAKGDGAKGDAAKNSGAKDNVQKLPEQAPIPFHKKKKKHKIRRSKKLLVQNKRQKKRRFKR